MLAVLNNKLRKGENNIMYCKACGAVMNDEGGKFCPACGKPKEAPTALGEISFWKGSLSRNVGGAIIAVLLVYGWIGVVNDVKYSMKTPTYVVSGFVFWSGILWAVLARKRKWLWFFVGMAISIPVLLLAGAVGGALR